MMNVIKLGLILYGLAWCISLFRAGVRELPLDYKIERGSLKSRELREETRKLWQYLNAKYIEKGVGTKLYRRSQKGIQMSFYGVLLKKDQDEIIEDVVQRQKADGLRTVFVLFYEKENFVLRENGWRRRQDEKLLRAVEITP